MSNPPLDRGRAGCLRTAAGGALLALLAPLAAAVRAWRTFRRGSESRVGWTAPGAGGRRLDLTVDVPSAAEARARTALVDMLVRVAERLRRPDDVYFLVFRQPWEKEVRVVGVGPQVQELGERLALAFSQTRVERCTHIWLTLAAGAAPGERIDPLVFDPETAGAGEALAAAAGARWWMETAFSRAGAAVVFRVILYGPGIAGAVQPLAAALRERLAGP